MRKARNQVIDATRAVAVVLMIVGHCIQYGSGREYLDSNAFFDDAVFKYIYSFHMPLFAAVSGYCFFKVVSKRSFHETLKDRVQKLFIPIIGWQFIINVIMVVLAGGGTIICFLAIVE